MELHTSDGLTMVAATLSHVRAELEMPGQLARLLEATVSAEWPTGEYDRDAMMFFRARLEEGGKDVEGWYSWYAVRDHDAESPRALVGAAGYFGPPAADGVVEIGYSVLPRWQRRGYARQMVQTLVEHAFSQARVGKVIAHTGAENLASVAVLRRCGFVVEHAGSLAGTLRFERTRSGSA